MFIVIWNIYKTNHFIKANQSKPLKQIQMLMDLYVFFILINKQKLVINV